jgi:hypothetical protein
MEMEVQRVEASPVLESLQRGEIDIQIKTAKQHPRDLAKVRDSATSMATVDEETATGCLYALPRRGAGTIEGGSIRLAEIIASTWGNLRIAKRVIGEDANKVTAQGVCHDLETNNAVSLEITRSIRYSKNHQNPDLRNARFPDDMIRVTEQAAASIALRNAIFACVPKSQWAPVLAAAKKVAVGDATTLNTTRARTLESFAAIGVTKEQVLQMVDQGSVEEITLDDVTLLRGIFSSLKSGEAQLEDVLKQAGADAPTVAAGGSRVAAVAKAVAPKPIKDVLPDAVQGPETPATATDEPGEDKCHEKTYKAIHELWMKMSNEAKAPIKRNSGFKMIVDVRKWNQSDAQDLLDHLKDGDE